jgi:hypothetical protein
MKKSYLFYFLLMIAFLAFSCKKPDITPAYLIFSADEFYVDVSNFNEKHDTNYDNEELEIIKLHTFNDVYVSINGHAEYWHMPCTIPVLPDYDHVNNIRIVPCAKIANNTATTIPYHFLQPVEKEIFLAKEERYNITDIKFEYRNEISIPLLETFVQSTNFASIDTANGAEIELVEENGKHYGKIVVNDQNKYFDVATDYFYLNGSSTRQLWEIYYKSNNGEMVTYLNFQNTVTGFVAQDMVIFPATHGDMKKAYIDITEWIYRACGTASRVSVRLGIRGLRNANAEKAEFFIGNVKLIVM